MPAVASLVVADLIRSARDEHPSFDDRRHPNPVLLRALSRYQRRLVPRIIRANPTALVQLQETNLPLADFDVGITLPDHKYPAHIEVETVPEEVGLRQRHYKVELVPWQGQLRYHLAAYIRTGKLFLTGAARDWTGFTKVRFFYMPEVETLTAVANTLVVPNAAEPCLVAYLCSLMAQRPPTDQSVPKPDAAWFRGAWREAEEEFLDEMGMHTQAQTSVVREVF